MRAEEDGEALITGENMVTSPSIQEQVDTECQESLPGEEEPIPPLTSIAPAIFVPITRDLLAPYTPPASRADRLRQTLSAVEANAVQVRANLVSLVQREHTRILRAARAQHAVEPFPDADTRVPQGELDEMIRCMEQPHDPNLDYNVTNLETPPEAWGQPRPPGSSREELARQLMECVGRGIREVKSYEAHVSRIREVYEMELKGEKMKRAAD